MGLTGEARRAQVHRLFIAILQVRALHGRKRPGDGAVGPFLNFAQPFDVDLGVILDRCGMIGSELALDVRAGDLHGSGNDFVVVAVVGGQAAGDLDVLIEDGFGLGQIVGGARRHGGRK